MLNELHQAHPGMSKMKGLARSYVWWPTWIEMLKRMFSPVRCVPLIRICRRRHPCTPGEIPTKSWSRIHVDYAGPIEGKMVLVTVDSYSKWIEADVVSGSSAQVTICRLRHLFASHGIPEIVVSDN